VTTREVTVTVEEAEEVRVCDACGTSGDVIEYRPVGGTAGEDAPRLHYHAGCLEDATLSEHPAAAGGGAQDAAELGAEYAGAGAGADRSPRIWPFAAALAGYSAIFMIWPFAAALAGELAGAVASALGVFAVLPDAAQLLAGLAAVVLVSSVREYYV
jgi:hypothetical protein